MANEKELQELQKEIVRMKGELTAAHDLLKLLIGLRIREAEGVQRGTLLNSLDDLLEIRRRNTPDTNTAFWQGFSSFMSKLIAFARN